jgi:putative nucleotidyltransferase with HDIG domain
MTTQHITSSRAEGYMPIPLESLRLDSILDFDIYIHAGRGFTLYRASCLPFTAETKEALLESNVRHLYVPLANRRQYTRYLEDNIREILADESVGAFAKASIVYDSAKELVKDVLNRPTLGENIRRSQAMVESTVLFILEGENAFHNILRVMSFDYHTYTHSVNVCTFSLALARQAGMTKTHELNELGTGALLHDVGKIKVSETILNKRGPLEPVEMDTIRQHPQWGVEIIKTTDLIPEVSYFPILQHHERENCSGYPEGICSRNIHPYSKIVAIADVFAALTTERVYRPAVDTFPALKTMYQQVDGFDRDLLDSFTRLMGPHRQVR